MVQWRCSRDFMAEYHSHPNFFHPGRDVENCLKLFLYSVVFAESYQLQANYRSSKCMRAMCPLLLHSFLWFFSDHHLSSLVGIQSLRKSFQKNTSAMLCLLTFEIRNVMWFPLQTTVMLLRPIYFSHLASKQKKITTTNPVYRIHCWCETRPMLHRRRMNFLLSPPQLSEEIRKHICIGSRDT